LNEINWKGKHFTAPVDRWCQLSGQNRATVQLSHSM